MMNLSLCIITELYIHHYEYIVSYNSSNTNLQFAGVLKKNSF